MSNPALADEVTVFAAARMSAFDATASMTAALDVEAIELPRKLEALVGRCRSRGIVRRHVGCRGSRPTRRSDEAKNLQRKNHQHKRKLLIFITNLKAANGQASLLWQCEAVETLVSDIWLPWISFFPKVAEQ